MSPILNPATLRRDDLLTSELDLPPSPSLLVRIYPVELLEHPIELGESPLLVGRDDGCALPLTDPSVSRRHAIITWDGEAHRLTDLGSTNGTWVDQHRVGEDHRLGDGDRIRFGAYIFKYLAADRIESQYHEVVFKIMTTDGLTSVYNKRYFQEALDREIPQALRCGTPLSVLMIDLDRFKGINDEFGHLAGDAVLVEFARRARSVLQHGELLARFGGEEFAVLLRAPLNEAVEVAHQLQRAAASGPVSTDAGPIGVTVSIGAASLTSRETAQDLVREADEMLYLAKRSGRNQVQSRWERG